MAECAKQLANAVELLNSVAEFQVLRRDLKSALFQAISHIESVKHLLEEKSEEIRIESDLKTRTDNARKSYSDILKINPEKVKAKHKILIKNKNSAAPAEETKKQFKTEINPRSLKIGITNIRNTKRGYVIVETETNGDLDKITQTINANCNSTLVPTKLNKFNPRMMIKNIPEEVNESNLLDTLKDQNEELGLNENNFKVVRIFKIRSNPKKRNAVIEVNPNLRQLLLDRRLKLYYSINYAEDYYGIRRCMKCYKYNHSEADCLGKLTCAICMEEHLTSTCTKTEAIQEYKCINCFTFNEHCKPHQRVSHNHSALSKGPETIRVSKFHREAKKGHFVSYLTEDTRTLYDAFRRGAKQSNNGKCLGWREGPGKPYSWLNYNEALLRARNFGSGLVSMGLVPGQDTIIGIYSTNCPEWVLTEQAAYCYSMVIVPLHDTLGPDACSFIISQAEISTIICENDHKCNLLLERASRHLRKIVVIKDASPATRQRAKNRGVEIHRFEEIEKIGAQKSVEELAPKPTDLCTICYTSGTTGSPKGVMLSHENVVAALSAILLQLGEHKPSADDVMISYLPLAHMLERCCENGMYMVGGAVGFYSGDIHRLTDDMKTLKPTISPTVPRVLNRLYDKTMAELSSSFIKRMIFNMALSAKTNEVRKGIIRKNSFWDKTVLRKIQESMGGHLRLMLVGSAPLAGTVLTFARAALGCLILEGYGQTECCAPITLTVQGDSTPEHVGPPVACCCVKLADVPEMEYYATHNQGEVCVKGSNVFQGYYKEYDTTLQTVDEYGWHHTGDIGQWQPNGTLKIIDRKKHVFKLSQGVYVVPEKIEAIYTRSLYVHQVFVYGESLKSCIVAIVVPNVDVVKSWAVENNIEGTFSVLCAHPEVKKLIMDDMITWGKEGDLKSFELVKDVYLHPDPFSVQNGLLTPTLKKKRPQLKAYFKPQLDDMYAKLT